MVQQIHNVISAQFGTTQYFNPVVLWECLVDRQDDEILMKSMASKSQHDETNGCHYVMKLRRAIIEHLASLFCKRNPIYESIGKPARPTLNFECTPGVVSQPPIMISSLQHKNTETGGAVYKLGLGHCIRMISHLSHLLPSLRRSLHATPSEKVSCFVSEPCCAFTMSM